LLVDARRLRAFSHGLEKRLLNGFPIPPCISPSARIFKCPRGRMIPKGHFRFSETGHAQERPAAIRPLGVTGKMPVPSKGWTPFEAQEPWQDRRTLKPRHRRDQRLAILRMVFAFLGIVPAFVNT
jgi:hypothetical protein